MICLNCNCEQDLKNKYCTECGNKLPEVAIKICSNCQSHQSIQSKYCTKCGSPLSDNNTGKSVNLNHSLKNDLPSITSKNKISPKTARILWLFFLLFVSILGILYQFSKQVNEGVYYNFWFTFLPSSFGSAIGFGLIPFITAFIRKIMKKKPTMRIFILYYTIASIAFIQAIRFMSF